MKAYGLPMNKDLECPDIADIKFYGLKTSIGSVKGKGGDYCTLYFNTTAKKKTARRFWKKRERRLTKALILAENG